MPITSMNFQSVNINGTSPGQTASGSFQISGDMTQSSNDAVTIYATNTVTNQTYVVWSGSVSSGMGQTNYSLNANVSPLDLPSGTYTFSAVADSGVSDDYDNGDFFVCFLAGTLIATPDGSVAVEDLARGDMVRTADGRAVPVLFVGRQTIHSRFALAETSQPVRIRAGALAENVPARDLFVSPSHAIVLQDTLCLAQVLVNGTTIARCAAPTEVFTYYSIELPAHEVILAEGAPVESFSDNVSRDLFDNGQEFAALYPQGRSVGEMALPLAKSARQVPASIRAAIAARAAVINGEDLSQAA